MTAEAESLDEPNKARPRRGYLRVFLLAAVLIAIGLAMISVRVAVLLAVLLLPALAVTVGMISRVDTWRPVLLRVWPATAFVIAVLFLLPGHLIYRMATSPEATFKLVVMDPVPQGVSNLEKHESRGWANWVSLTFDADAKTISEIIEAKPFQVQASIRPELRERVGQINLADVIVYEASYPANRVRYSAIVSRRTSRVCIVSERY